MYKLIYLLLIFCSCLSATAQEFTKVELSKQDDEERISSIYAAGNFEVFNQLTLYKDNSFYYQYKHLGLNIFSNGWWTKKNDMIILNSEIDSTNVPIKILFFKTDTVKAYYIRTSQHTDSNPTLYNTKFQVPINLKKDLLPDAMIYINNDTTYCFPFFDTCVGTYNQIERVKISFGNGFKSKWTSIDAKDFKRLLCIAQVDFLFANYRSYINYRLKIIGDKLKSLD